MKSTTIIKGISTAIRNYFDPARLGPHNFAALVLASVAIGFWRKARKTIHGGPRA